MPLKTFLKFYFGLKQPKMTIPEGGVRLQGPLSSSQCPLLRPKNVLLFPELPFYFQNCFFIFQYWSFIFQKCPFVSWNCPLFIYCVGLFPRMFFSPANCTFSLSSELLREIIFAMLLFCFLLELFIDQLMPCILKLFA